MQLARPLLPIGLLAMSIIACQQESVEPASSGSVFSPAAASPPAEGAVPPGGGAGAGNTAGSVAPSEPVGTPSNPPSEPGDMATVAGPTVGLGGAGVSGPAGGTSNAGGGTPGVEVTGAAGGTTVGEGGTSGSGAVVGEGGTSGSGAVVGEGGTSGSGAVVGEGGTSGSGAGPGCSDGCAELSVPFDTWNSGEYFEIYLSGATDLSDAVISVTARKVSGKAGGLLVVVKDGADQDYAYAQSDWYAISEMTSEFETYTLDVSAPSATDENATFTPTAVQIISIQLAAGDTWYTDDSMTTEDTTALVNPTVVQIDEISISGTGTLPGPWPFTGSASELRPNLDQAALDADPPYAVAGSSVTWIEPE